MPFGLARPRMDFARAGPARASSLLVGVLLATTAGLGACANMSPTETGFLDDYAQLAPAPEFDVFGIPDTVRLVLRGGDDWPDSRAIHIEPVQFVPGTARAEAISQQDRDRLVTAFEAALVREFGSDHVLADAAGPGVLSFRAAITDAEPAIPWLNWVMLVLIVPTSYGGVSAEMELRDGGSGRRLAAMTAAREGTAFLLLECFSRWGHAEHSMEKWAALWRDMLSDHQGQPTRSNPGPGRPARPIT